MTTPLSPGSPLSQKIPSKQKTNLCHYHGCQQAFNRPAKLAQHIRSHTNERPFVCPYSPCSKAYLGNNHLTEHIQTVHVGERKYVCDWEGCDKRFATNQKLRKHKLVHEGHERMGCRVEGCNQVFRKRSTMQAHIRKIHEGQMPYFCAFLDESGKMCGMGFERASLLKRHEGTSHGRRTYECTICRPQKEDETDMRKDLSQRFLTYIELQKHISTTHPPTCGKCDFIASSSVTLKNHVEAKHGDTDVHDRKIHMCLEAGCLEAFVSKSNLNAHIRLHKAKKNICEKTEKSSRISGWDGSNACGRGFVNKWDMIEHVKTAHLGLKPKPKKQKWKKDGRIARHELIALSKVTGLYDIQRDEDVCCAIRGCKSSFSSQLEHAAHLHARHGLAESEIQTLLQSEEQETTFGRPRLQGGQIFADEEDRDAELYFDLQGNDGEGMELENGWPSLEGNDADRWMEEDGNYSRHDGNEWPLDEVHMRQLID